MKKNLIKHKSKIIFILIFIYTFVVLYLSRADNDYIWNYGFCKNLANGLLMYKDYNMVITPLYPTIFGTLMKIFGVNTLTFTFFNTIMIMFIYVIVYKKYPKAFIPTLLICSYNLKINYNFLCILLLFVLIYLEDRKGNDYLIGFTLGLIFLTKSNFGMLTLASLYYIKDIKKIIKRVIGFIIPNLMYIIYFALNGSLLYYLNYAFGGLIDFSQNTNTNIIGLVFSLILLAILIYWYIKNKDIKLLYIILFQIMSYPIFNFAHISYSMIPVLFYIFLNLNVPIKNNFIKNYLKLLIGILLLCPLISITLFYILNKCEFGTNSLKYKLIETKYSIDANTISKNVEDLDNTYFIMYEAYYNKLLLNLNINRYDLLLIGNMGYKGCENVIKYFDSLPEKTKFLTYVNFENGDASINIYNHITSNYKLIKIFDKYALYEK